VSNVTHSPWDSLQKLSFTVKYSSSSIWIRLSLWGSAWTTTPPLPSKTDVHMPIWPYRMSCYSKSNRKANQKRVVFLWTVRGLHVCSTFRKNQITCIATYFKFCQWSSLSKFAFYQLFGIRLLGKSFAIGFPYKLCSFLLASIGHDFAFYTRQDRCDKRFSIPCFHSNKKSASLFDL